MKSPFSRNQVPSKKSVTSRRKPANSLHDYTVDELLKELQRRLRHQLARRSHQNEDYRSAQNKQREVAYVRHIEPKGRPKAYANDSFTTEERLAEKMWWWLAEFDHATTEKWAHLWLDKYRADSVGTHNLSNREAWLKKTLKKIPKGSKILDAGAGELQYKRFCKHLDYTSQDFAQYTGEGNKAGLQMGSWDNSKLDIVSDITEIPVKNQSFDAIMCIEVFEHIPKPIEAVKEFSRIIRSGGQLIITAPFASFTHFAPYYFYNGYSKYFYEEILPEYGFEIKEIFLNGNFFEYVAQEVRRIDGVAERYAPTVQATAFDQLVKQWLLRRLEKLSGEDTGSNEFAAHDIHVLAEKK